MSSRAPSTSVTGREHRYRTLGWWPDEPIIERLRRVVDATPDAPAVTTADARLTYGQLWERAALMGDDLEPLPPRAVVMIAAPNGTDWVVAHTMIGQRGWTPASIPSTSSADHLTHAISTADVQLVLTDESGASTACRAVERAANGAGVAVLADGGVRTIVPSTTNTAASLDPHVGQLFFTSSTTGPPKAVVHTHNTLAAMHTLMAERFAVDHSTPIFMPSPFGHSVGGMHGVRMAQWVGCELVTMPSWDADAAIELIDRTRPYYTAAATPFLVDLVRAPAPSDAMKLESVCWFLCGGAAVPPDLIRRARTELPRTTVTPLWGMTEGGVTTCVPDSTPRQFEETVGTPMPGLELAVVDETGRVTDHGDGELVMRGPAVFTGYLGAADVYRDSIVGDGWFRTGDLAQLDADGYVTVVGRVKDLIVRGGVNLSPVATEHALMAHPAITSAAVIGWPDERLGERICAVVQVDGEPPGLADVTRHCLATGLEQRLLPERLIAVAEFPRTAAGKIRKQQLKSDLVGGIMQHVALGDIDVAYRVWGSGPPMVLVHGLAEAADSWQPVAPLIDGHTVYAYDLRGHGATTIGAADGTLAQLGQDLINFLTEVIGPAPVVGFSLGGTVVLWAAAERPELIPHATVVGTSSVVGRAAASFFQTRIDQLDGGLTDEFTAAFADDNAGMIASSADPRPVYERRMQAIGDGRGYVNGATAMAALNEAPLTPRLASVTCPVDVVVGTEDAFCPPKASQMILDELPDGRLHHVEGAGHLVAVDRPNELSALLNTLLTEHPETTKGSNR